jgi:hypothetical protein
VSGRPTHKSNSADVANRQSISRGRLPAIIVLIIDLLAFVTLVCVALTVPILWTALTKTNVQPRTPDQHCAAVKDDAARLACYDRVLRENSPRVMDKND